MCVTKEFNYRQLVRMEELLKKNQAQYRIDLHIHTCYSSDGIQTVDEAILSAKNKGIDIISIADHDSINAYKEIVENNINDLPIIIPGIEFTVWYPEYKGRCHILKYFYDSKDKGFNDCLRQNEDACWKRVKIWFERIKGNQCLQYFFKNYDIQCSESAYERFLCENKKIPEYTTISEYLFSLLKEKHINVWMVYEKMLEYNKKDDCLDRRLKKEAALKRFYDKYSNQDIAQNYKKLKPLIAPVDVDDAEYNDFFTSGSLSVNEYGQIAIWQLDNSGFNVLAHPAADKVDCVDNLKNLVQGMELNYRSGKSLNEKIYKKAMANDMLITKGSDKHTNDNSYDEIEFYNISHYELQKLVYFARCAIK